MSSQTNLLLTKGALGSLPNTVLNGRLAIGLDDTNNRAKLIVDDNNKRYAFALLWDEIINKPDMSKYITVDTFNSKVTELNNSISTKVDKENGVAKDLGIAASLTDGAAKAVLTYNTSTQSLDFNFT